MKIKPTFSKLFILLLVLFVASCNLFNPTGSRTPSSSDPDALILEGYLYYQDGKYEKASNMFEKAIKADSTKSEAWLGLAKSTLYQYDVNPFELIPYFKVDENEIPFMAIPNDYINLYYNGISKTLLAIHELVRRDTLTSLYLAYTNAVDNKEELSSSLADFKKTYGNKLNQFPLSDKKIIFPNFAVGFGILAMADIMIQFRHATIDFSPSIFIDPETQEVEFDIDSLYSGALEDSLVISKFNESLLDLNQNIDALSASILPSVVNWSDDSGAFLDGDSLEYVAELEDALNEQIDNLNSISFYLIGDHIDNDGDGCVDEEILDTKDNDNDGLVDEDLRVVPLIRSTQNDGDEKYSVVDSIGTTIPMDHDGDGVIGNKEESTYFISTIEERQEKDNYLLSFATSFSHMETDILIKQQVMQDIDIKNIQYDLDWRKENVGGCWENYNQERFEAWFSGR